jgi:ABC-2 type transport system ATP-binding protein
LTAAGPDRVLSAKGLARRYGAIPALVDFSLDVHRGEIVAVVGENGAGKSTAFAILCGLLQADDGQTEYRFQASGSTRQRVGYCPQDTVVWNELTCVEQLVFFGLMYGGSRAEVTRRADELLLSLGLDEARARTARKLSGGMRRRLSLALSLVNQPELLILDEPETGLDLASRQLFRDLCKRLAREGTAILLATHDLHEVKRLADRVAILHRGRVLSVQPAAGLDEQALQDAVAAARPEQRPCP